MKRCLAAALAILTLTQPALAAVGCQGTVTQVMLQPEGTALVDFGFGNFRMCEMNSSITVNRGPNVGGNATLTPVMCQALYTSFLTAKSTGKQVIAYLDAASCNLGNGSLPNPYPYYFYFLQ